MNIVIIGPAHPLRGGLAAFNERLARAFMSEGDKVEIYSFSLQYPRILFPGKTQFTDIPAPRDLKIYSAINSINPFNWNKTGKEIKNKNPDLVIIAYWMPFMARALGRIARIIRSNGKSKVIAIVHNLIPHEKRFFDHSFTSYFVKSVDAFAALSQSVLDDIEKFDPLKPKILTPHPVYDHYGTIRSKEEAKKNLGLGLSANYILFFGFIRAYKGLDLLLEAFADKRLEGYNLKLLIAGEFYSDKRPYLQLIEKLKTSHRVIIADQFIPENKVADYFCASDIVVQPYKTATQSGITQIAYHFNRPMIVTNTGGLPEMVPHRKAGYVVEPSAQEIADVLVDFYSGKCENIFSQYVESEKKRFAWNVLTAKLKELNRKLTG